MTTTPTDASCGAIAAITLWQPWATWIAWRWKTIETRGHDRFRRLVGQFASVHVCTWRAPREEAPAD